MSEYFSHYDKSTDYTVSIKQQFNTSLDKFLARDRSKTYININDEFAEIENFLSYQPEDFFEETFLTTVSKIINNFSIYSYSAAQIASAQVFVNILKKDKFKAVFPKLKNYGTLETFSFIEYLLQHNNIILAENITNIFIHPEKRTLKSFRNNVIEWCLKNTKIAALKFLIQNYEGFNDKNIQSLFLNYAELGEEYLVKVFPENIYPNNLEPYFNAFFNNTSIVLSKKLELISYFSAKTPFVPKECISWIRNGLIENSISVETLKKYDFFDKLFSQGSLNNFFLINNSNYVSNLTNYLSSFISEDKIPETIFSSIKNNKEINSSIFNEFIQKFPLYIKNNSDLIKKHIIDNNLEVSQNLYLSLKSQMTIDSEFNDYLLKRSPNLYFFINNIEEDKHYIDTLITTIFEKRHLVSAPDSIYEKYSQSIVDKMLKKYGHDTLFDLFFMNNSNFSNLLKNVKITLVYNIENFSEKKLEDISYYFGKSIKKELEPKKWYQVTQSKPLQIVYKNNEFSVIKKPEKKISVEVLAHESESQYEESSSSNGISNIILQAKKDLMKFNQIISQPIDFNLEFKIRSESIFMQQMNFLTQIQKIENELNFEDLYFLKNNLGKYLIQCTETYSRALTRYQTLLENPGLFKKQDNTLESQKEKIDTEALKQVALLEKELEFVKERVVQTINSDSVSDMRINTRFLEATTDHGSEEGIVKLMNTKPR